MDSYIRCLVYCSFLWNRKDGNEKIHCRLRWMVATLLCTTISPVMAQDVIAMFETKMVTVQFESDIHIESGMTKTIMLNSLLTSQVFNKVQVLP